MKRVVVALIAAFAGLAAGCTSFYPAQGVDTNTMNLAVQRGDTVLYIKHSQVVPTEAVKHDSQPGMSASAINWGELGGVIVGQVLDSATEIAKSQNETRAKTISNGTEIMAVGFNTPGQQDKLNEIIRESKGLVECTTLKDAIVQPGSQVTYTNLPPETTGVTLKKRP